MKAKKAMILLAALAQASHTQGEYCSALLESGIHDEIRERGSTTTSSEHRTALCAFSSSYSYSKYEEDRKKSQSGSSAQEVDTSYKLFAFRGSNANSKLSESEFNILKESFEAQKESFCSATSSDEISASNWEKITKTVSPALITAYNECLRVTNAGLVTTVKGGLHSRTITVDLKFIRREQGSVATLDGVSVTGPVECELPKDMVNSPNGQLEMVPNRVYAITCTAPSSSTTNEEVHVKTSLGTVVAYIHRDLSLTRAAELQNQINAMEAELISKINDLRNRHIGDINNHAVDIWDLRDKFNNHAVDIVALRGEVGKKITKGNEIQSSRFECAWRHVGGGVDKETKCPNYQVMVGVDQHYHGGAWRNWVEKILCCTVYSK